ncbi:PPR containing plant-like protein [Medicago truncatula]|uniref:PPR containing plant-like protein n=2 Tax=Medicago truncatula TaxID=3880 RepID=A0A072VHN1_MEDTR|nr:PPR containing plant-like protein [Medicago truncatula]
MKPLLFSQRIWTDTFSNQQILKLNHKLTHLTKTNQFYESLKLFTKIHSSHKPDHCTLSTTITATSKTRHVTVFGNQLHSFAIKTALKAYSHVANSLLSLYAKAHDLVSVELVFDDIQCPDVYSWTTVLSAISRLSDIDYALHVFDKMPKCYVAVWNAIITGCSDNGCEDVAFRLLKDMFRMNVRGDNYTFATMLSLCPLSEGLDYGRHVHSVVVKSGFLDWTSVVNSLITMYFNCGCVVDGYKVFEEMEGGVRNHVTYNAMIDGFVSVERFEDAFLMFRDMHRGSVCLSEVTFVSVLSSCCSLRVGCQAQGLAIKMGFDCGYTAVNNATMTMYSFFGKVNEARSVFEIMEESRDLVSWNVMVSMFFQENINEDAILTYIKMRREGIEPDAFTYGSLLSASDSLQMVEMIHSVLCKNGLNKVEVLNALISSYSRNGQIKRAFQIFSDLAYKSLISWNSIISGFVLNGYPMQGLEKFSALLNTHLKPNAYSLSLALSICSCTPDMDHGKQVHGYILRHGFDSEISLGNALVTMYSKCGFLDRSLSVFNEMVERDTITWNAIISAYSQHGQGKEAVHCFEAMQISPGIKPDHATFTAVLSACSHSGLVDDATRIFDIMVNIYGFVPSVDHFSCIVDLLGRSGYLDEAERVVTDGYFGAHPNMCWSLFSACAVHGNLTLGRKVARLLLEREQNNPSVYVLLANICAEAGQWEEAAKLRDMVKQFGTTKQPGCSWIST